MFISLVTLSCTWIFAYNELKSVVGNCTIVDVVNPTVVLPTPTFVPIKSIHPNDWVPIPGRSVLKSVFNILISWSLSNFSSGVNTKVFLWKESDSAVISPNLVPVSAADLSNIIASLVVVETITSLIWASLVSGSMIWIRYLT